MESQTHLNAKEAPAAIPVDSRASDRRAAREKIIQRVRLLLQARAFLCWAALIGVFASIVFVLLIPPRYEATAQLMPPDRQSGAGVALLSAVTGNAGGLGGLAGDLLGVKNSGALFVGILQGRTVQDRLIEQFDLRRIYGAQKMEDSRKALASHTLVVEDRRSGIISITVTDHDPQHSAAMAQAYIDALDLLVQQVSTSSARRERVFLEDRLRAVKQDLDSAAQKFSLFASKNTAIDIPAQSKAMVEAAAGLQGQLIAAESELRGMEAIYTDQNVRVRALRARVMELRNQLRKIGGDGKALTSASGDAEAYPAIRQLPLLGVTYADLYRQTKIQETVYELLTQQYELAKVQEVKEVPSVKVLDAPVVPTKKSYPPRTLFTAAGTALIFLAACGWILLKQGWQDVDPDDPAKQFAAEFVGVLRAESARFAPVVSAMRTMALRFRRPAEADSPRNGSVKQAVASESQELSRAARNSAG